MAKISSLFQFGVWKVKHPVNWQGTWYLAGTLPICRQNVYLSVRQASDIVGQRRRVVNRAFIPRSRPRRTHTHTETDKTRAHSHVDWVLQRRHKNALTKRNAEAENYNKAKEKINLQSYSICITRTKKLNTPLQKGFLRKPQNFSETVGSDAARLASTRLGSVRLSSVQLSLCMSVCLSVSQFVCVCVRHLCPKGSPDKNKMAVVCHTIEQERRTEPIFKSI